MKLLKWFKVKFNNEVITTNEDGRTVTVRRPKLSTPVILMNEAEYSSVLNEVEYQHFWSHQKTFGLVFDSIEEAKNHAIKASGKYYILSTTEHFCVDGIINPYC